MDKYIPSPSAFTFMRDIDELQKGIAAAITRFVKRGYSLEMARKVATTLLSQMEHPRQTVSLVHVMATSIDDGTGETRARLAEALSRGGVITNAARKRIRQRLSAWRVRLGGTNRGRLMQMLDRAFDIGIAAELGVTAEKLKAAR